VAKKRSSGNVRVLADRGVALEERVTTSLLTCHDPELISHRCSGPLPCSHQSVSIRAIGGFVEWFDGCATLK
jgi:hypothetical protein